MFRLWCRPAMYESSDGPKSRFLLGFWGYSRVSLSALDACPSSLIHFCSSFLRKAHCFVCIYGLFGIVITRVLSGNVRAASIHLFFFFSSKRTRTPIAKPRPFIPVSKPAPQFCSVLFCSVSFPFFFRPGACEPKS